jgi:hypothetical protein
LHLTVGKIDADRHDLHARFYLNGNCFEPDLSRFWPVDPALVEQLPPTVLDEVARYQMGEKVVVDFPDAWRKNVIETKRAITIRPWEFGGQDGHDRWAPSLDLPVWLRTERALREITRDGGEDSFTEDYLVTLQSLVENPAVNLIIETCVKHQVTPEELLGEAQPYEVGF